MIGLDSNILVSLAAHEHPANARTVSAVKSALEENEKIVLTTPVVMEFLHVLTDARRFSPPHTTPAAIEWMQNFLTGPSVSLIEAPQIAMEQTFRWMREFNIGRKRIIDTNLAATLHTSGVRRLMTLNPADFSVFGVFEIITP